MNILYIYNKGSQIHVRFNNIHIQYLGPKVLSRFIKVNDYTDGCISVDTEYKIDNKLIVEEDYIDLRDVFSLYDYDIESILKSISKIEIGKPPMRKK